MQGAPPLIAGENGCNLHSRMAPGDVQSELLNIAANSCVTMPLFRVVSCVKLTKELLNTGMKYGDSELGGGCDMVG